MQYLDPSDAVKLMRICQTWSGPAVEAFYSTLTLRSPLAFPKLVHLITNTQTNMHPYALLIRELVFTGEAADDLMMGDLKQTLEQCTNLASLRLEGCTLVSGMVAQFLKDYAPFLSRVEFPGSQISDSFLLSLIRGVKSLRHIDVSYTNVTLSMLPILVRECQYLETLQMTGCQPSLDEMMVDEYENSEFYLVGDSLKQFKSPLKQVDVSGTMIGDKMISYLSRHCDNLETLIMDGCSLITDDAITSIAMYSKNIKFLNLSFCDITDVSLQSLAIHLGSPSATAQLTKNAEHGSYKDFSEYHPSTNQNVEKGIQLELIVLTGCSSISANGITFLASKCPNLQTIVLDGCDRVTDWYYTDSNVSTIDTNLQNNQSPELSAYSALDKLSYGAPSAVSSDDGDSFVTALSDVEVVMARALNHSQKSLRRLSLNRQQVLDKTQ